MTPRPRRTAGPGLTLAKSSSLVRPLRSSCDLVRPLRLSCAAAVLVLCAFLWASAPKIAASGSNDASSGKLLRGIAAAAAAEPEPGNPGKEPPKSVAGEQPDQDRHHANTAVAVIHVIRTAIRPTNVDSEPLFTVISVFPEDRLLELGNCCPRRR
jgi:hypothetical protein